MSSIHILHVEDEENDKRILRNAAADFSEENEDKIVIYEATSVAEAKQIMSETNIDAAIVDLKLGAPQDNPEGVELVNDIKNSIPVLTVIYSGTTGYVQDIVTEDNLFLRAYTKGEETPDTILKELHGLYKTGITQLFSHNELLEEYKALLRKVFYVHISNSIDYWIHNNDKESLHRYIQHHIAEYYKLDSFGGLVNYSPAEMYMSPTINPCPHTGDIILHEDFQYLVVTPACDIVLRGEVRNSDFIMMLRLGRIENYVSINEGKISNTQKKKLKDTLKKYRYYDLPLPKFGHIYSSVIDFQNVVTITNELFTAEYSTRLATIPESFMKDIVHQFSSYYSRQGAPNVAVDSFYAKMI